MRDGENMQAALERARAGLTAQVMDVYDFQGGGGAKSLLLQAIPENQMKQIEAVDKNSRLYEFTCMVARSIDANKLWHPSFQFKLDGRTPNPAYSPGLAFVREATISGAHFGCDFLDIPLKGPFRALKRKMYPAGGVGQKEFEGAVEAMVNEIGGKYISFHRLVDFIFMMLPSGESGEMMIRGIVKACRASSPLQFTNHVTALARQWELRAQGTGSGGLPRGLTPTAPLGGGAEMGMGGSTSVSLNRGSHTDVRKGSSTTMAAVAAAGGGGGHLVPLPAGPQVPIVIMGEDVAQPGADQDMPQAMGGGSITGSEGFTAAAATPGVRPLSAKRRREQADEGDEGMNGGGNGGGAVDTKSRGTGGDRSGFVSPVNMTPRHVKQPGNILQGLGLEPPGRGSGDRISFGNLLKEAPVFRDGEMQAVVESSKLIKIGIEGVEESMARRDLVQFLADCGVGNIPDDADI
uniref:Uncharacterized protein n=1 Tax=Chromera velia CCMP2878 TaxID=1169474 RepID=A0A0G4HHV8_9ALVE|eukprot:Cvel_27735.t1-p1 / transcript=Cvel_27735.t1 / gene=Cvel_27735 / organism=Chromera_velia_CCMP2878 / gene_product=hypothetical protein / transcript_product=hypothetical protein / location=Cvel_scaffold3512:755-2140(+) / protein_length=462 / sequence_SO=supercontig / SO=protein_coding / is_pseudo=false